MNMVDVVVVLVFLGIFTAGFFAGLGRALAACVAVFIGLLAAGIFYPDIADALEGLVPGLAPWAAEFVAFLITFAIMGAAALYALLR